LAVAQLNNYVTHSRARVKGNKNTAIDEFNTLLARVKPELARRWSTSIQANLNGIVVELITTSKHQADFWKNNWWPANNPILPHARIYSVQNVGDQEPGAYYCPQLNTALFVNTEYYGQCKSWALGMAAAILEKRFNTLSIHGATALYKGRGVVIIAPTGTGKTTHSFKIFQNADGRICGDDWAYVAFPEDANNSNPLIARQPEKALYMRSESQREHTWLREVFDRSMSENVTTSKEDCEYPRGPDGCSVTGKKCVFNEGKHWCYYSYANSRVLIKREDLLGPSKVVDEVPINLVVLLRRDDHSPAEVRLTSDEAIEILRKGESMVLPGAGPKEKWGTISTEPWYNPYLLELDNSRQERFFRAMFEVWDVPCVILNTGVESIQQSHERIIAALNATPSR
jgi:hypothetical protein